MSEDDLLTAVIDTAHAYNFRVAHFRPARTAKGWRTAVAADGRGFPDLVLAKQGRVLFAELKTSVGLTTDAQEQWLDDLGAFGYLWTPKQWMDGTILKILSWRSPG